MKTICIYTILFGIITLPVFGELTADDLSKIRQLIQEETQPIKNDIKSIKDDIKKIQIDNAWVRGILEGTDKRVTHATNVTYALIVLLVAAIGIPMTITIWRSGKVSQQDKINHELRQAIEELKQNQTVTS